MPFDIESKLKVIPNKPGCYIMKDTGGVVVYVGKASQLRTRIRSYFAASGDNRFFVHLLNDILGDIDTIVTDNDKEALILENYLIKTHQPRFNVKLKDDKNYLHLRLDTSHPYPRLEVIRRPKKDKARYFGPYHSATAIRRTLSLINGYFNLRTCSNRELSIRNRPCLQFHMHRCPAPCVGKITPQDYSSQVESTVMFLEGRTPELIKELQERMARASENWEYELAAKYRNQIEAITLSLKKQDVFILQAQNRLIDVIGYCREGALVVIHLLRLQHGFLADSKPFALKQQEFPDEEILSSFISQFYANSSSIPDEVYLPFALELQSSIALWLSDKTKTTVKVLTPHRRQKRRLVEMANSNAKSSFERLQDIDAERLSALEHLYKKLKLTRFPQVIECFDISNIQGKEPVGSLVVFEQGVPAPARYRHFKIKAKDDPNDFLMMFEVLTRHLKRVINTEEQPDLIMVDGGKGQLNVLLQVMNDLDISGIDAISLAKSRVSGKKNYSEAPKRSFERVFLPGVRDPIALPPHSKGSYLLMHLRDESHRFAIQFHKRLRRKRTLSSELDAIVGVGKKMRQKLLVHFGSVKRIRGASEEELCAVEGVGPVLARRIIAGLCTGSSPL